MWKHYRTTITTTAMIAFRIYSNEHLSQINPADGSKFTNNRSQREQSGVNARTPTTW